MINLPDKGFLTSKKAHNSKIDIVCDWLEASTIFDEGIVSKPQVVDVLCDFEIYSNSDFAFEFTEILFRELELRRKGMGGAYPFTINKNEIEARGTWQENIEYSFCLLISLFPYFKKWKEDVNPNYLTQGALFEAITAFRFQDILPEWKVERCGWTRDHATPLSDLMPDIAELLCERPGDLGHWAGKSANDAGLDVLCVRQFPDEREGFFTLLIQCASGENWKTKLRDPNLNEWMKYIDFVNMPCKAVSIPYALDGDKFRGSLLRSGGLLFDRLRLFSNTRTPIPADVAQSVEEYLQPALDCLPTM